MFSVSKAHHPRVATGSASWLESRIAPTRRSFELVAVASRGIVDLLERELRDGLAPRALSLAIGHLQGGAGSKEIRATFRFEASDNERRALADLVQHLCAVKGVRYLRLDSR
jgi:hypothetical protein